MTRIDVMMEADFYILKVPTEAWKRSAGKVTKLIVADRLARVFSDTTIKQANLNQQQNFKSIKFQVRIR